jgi:hypothetical protein
VFLIGDALDFEKASVRQLLQIVIDKEMKPFTLFLHRLQKEILEIEYPMLCLKGKEKKKLTLYPNLIVKCKDI